MVMWGHVRIWDSTDVSIFVDILVELTNTVFVNSTKITTNIETAALSNHNGFLMMAPRLQDDTEDLGPDVSVSMRRGQG